MGLVAILSWTACKGGDAPAERKAQAAKTGGAEAKAVEPAKPAEAPKPAEPLWPAPLPAGWKLVNDFENDAEPPKGELRGNLLGGVTGTWGYKAGKCRIEIAPEGGSKRMKILYALPMGDSQCGTFEQFAGEKGKAKPFDLSAYDRMVFLLKSGDDAEHKVRFEVVELDPYDAAQQGYTGETKLLTAGKEWQRVEVKLDEILHPMFKRKSARQAGIRIDRKTEENASGVLLIDNVAFIEKGK